MGATSEWFYCYSLRLSSLLILFFSLMTRVLRVRFSLLICCVCIWPKLLAIPVSYVYVSRYLSVQRRLCSRGINAAVVEKSIHIILTTWCILPNSSLLLGIGIWELLIFWVDMVDDSLSYAHHVPYYAYHSNITQNFVMASNLIPSNLCNIFIS